MLESDEKTKTRKAMTRETYNAMLALADDGCPNVLDLDEYEIIDDEPQLSSFAAL